MRVVADTNVLISGLFWDGNESRVLKLIKTGEIVNLTSPNIIIELENVISRDKFQLTEGEVDSAISEIISISRIVNPETKLNVIDDDPDDNIILECAVGGNAELIISGDGHLLDLKEYEGIRILSARDFLSENE